jgi:hypothetical protein
VHKATGPGNVLGGVSEGANEIKKRNSRIIGASQDNWSVALLLQ